MSLQIGTELLQRADLLVDLGQMRAQDGEDLLLGPHAAWVREIEIDDVADFIQAKAKPLQLIDLAQAGERLFGRRAGSAQCSHNSERCAE